MQETLIQAALATAFAATAAIGVAGALKLKQRLELSRAKHPSLAGHVRWSQRMARWLPGYDYREEDWLRLDGAPDEVVARRAAAFGRLAGALTEASPQTLAQAARMKPHLPDMQFLAQYRMPFQFRARVSERLPLASIWAATDDAWLVDLDGRRFLDATGSYGVNLFGNDFYKQTLGEGAALAHDLGALLGSYHPCVEEAVGRLLRIARKDQVTFHMSGTEAVMQAVRVARYNAPAGRRKLVRFTGAYHGWWDDVQPGPGNPMPPARHTLTVAEMSERTLHVLRTRNDIACVLVNPLQAMHPNRAAPGDSTLVDGQRSAGYDRAAYTRWLQQLREVCSARGIALIFDEVFLGFRLAPGGAQEYFGVEADLVTYGKTLGGGLPIGAVCGKAEWMRRFKPGKPADICFARGTFKEHPQVMACMTAFLRRLDTPAIAAAYQDAQGRWAERLAVFNGLLQKAGVPVHAVGMETVWTLCFRQPGRYHWLLQYYLRRHGVALSWVGSGRMIFPINWSDEIFEAFCRRVVNAAQAMAADGWWWLPPGGLSAPAIRRQVLREMLGARRG